jgi:hypothetical protein
MTTESGMQFARFSVDIGERVEYGLCPAGVHRAGVVSWAEGDSGVAATERQHRCRSELRLLHARAGS